MRKFKIKRTALFAVLAALALSPRAGAAELPESLVPVGRAVGILVRTDGAVVSELSELGTGDNARAPARDAGIRPGDVIVMVGDAPVTSAQDMARALKDAPESVTVRYRRDGRECQTSVRPWFDGGEGYLGVWVRDSVSGIGTVTYYDPASGAYGALGHSIADSATGALLPLREGSILRARVTDITKSRAGSPGELSGELDYNAALGTVLDNCQVGIFGEGCEELSGQAVPTAPAAQVRTGPAVLLSDVSGQRREYDIEITRIYSGAGGRDMMLRVTDPDLLALTGGIVQGMSGSPILQDGRLVGAVTHVLINDPQKGYGVFLETMLASR